MDERIEDAVTGALGTVRVELEVEVERLHELLSEDNTSAKEALIRARLSGLEYALAVACMEAAGGNL